MRLLYVILLLVGLTAYAAEPLTLDSCLDMARANNPELRKAQLEVAKAEQVKMQALTKYFPQIKATGGAFHALHPLVEVTIDDVKNESARELLTFIYENFGDELNISNSLSFFHYGYTAGVTAIQPVFVGGKIIAGNKLAKVGVEAAQLQAEVAERDVLQEVEESYWLLYGLEQKRQLIDEVSALLDTLARQVESAVNAGLALPSDLLEVQLRQDEMARKRLQVTSGQHLARRALALSIGYEEPDSLVIQEPPVIPELPATDSMAYEELGVTTAETPEHELLQLQLRAAKLERQMALAEALPQIAFGANYGYGYAQADLLKDGLRSKTGNGALFVTVSVPITQWWETGHKLKQHDYALEQAQLDADYYGAQLDLRTQQAYDQVQEAEALLRLQQRSVEHAQEAFRQAQSNYNAGRTTITDLLKTQAALTQTQSDLTDARTGYLLALRRYESLTKR